MKKPKTRVAIAMAVMSATLWTVPWVPAGASVGVSKISRIWVEPTSGYGFIDAAIRGATKSVDVSMYELSDPNIVQDLVQKAHASVSVRVILNAAYDGESENATAYRTLKAAGVQVMWAPRDQIFHAKYVVIDDKSVYIGTGNFVPTDYASTRDFWVTDTTSADVKAVIATFSADFAGEDTDAHQSGGLVWSPGATAALEAVISQARQSLLVENEEMDSAPIENALLAAAKRGVSVDVVMTQDTEWTAALERLAAAGVRVRLLSEAQVYIHAKVICADCTGTSGTVFIGSENFSTASLEYNRELGVVTTSPEVVRAVRGAVDEDFAIGALVTVTTAPTSGSGASSGGVTIVALGASVSPGSEESLEAHASAGSTCSLTVVLPSGYTSEASGLSEATANGAGDVFWDWKIGTSTDPGTATAKVSCPAGTATKTFAIT